MTESDLDPGVPKAKPVSDKKMAAKQTRRRKDHHPVIDPTSVKKQFKVGDNVTNFKGYGVAVYSFFRDNTVW